MRKNIVVHNLLLEYDHVRLSQIASSKYTKKIENKSAKLRTQNTTIIKTTIINANHNTFIVYYANYCGTV